MAIQVGRRALVALGAAAFATPRRARAVGPGQLELREAEATTRLVAVPWRADRVLVSTNGNAAARVQTPEDFTADAVGNLIDGSDTFLGVNVYNTTTHGDRGPNAGAPWANFATVDFTFFGTAVGFTQVLSSEFPDATPLPSCRIWAVAHPLEAVALTLPSYGGPDRSAQIRTLIAATDLPRRWHHAQLCFLPDAHVDHAWWLENLLLEANEINTPAPNSSIWPRANSVALNAANYTEITPRSLSPYTEGYGFSRIAFVNTTRDSVTVRWRARLANGPAITDPDIITIGAADTRLIDAPSGHPWTQSIEAIASVPAGVFMRAELVR